MSEWVMLEECLKECCASMVLLSIGKKFEATVSRRNEAFHTRSLGGDKI